MDDVERMYRHLVRTIRATAPQLLTQPFRVSDLYSTILPYRLHRRELGLETNQDYEIALLELLSGARGYLVVDDRMREVLGGSLKSPNPDPALIRDFATSRVTLSPDELRQLDGEGQPAASASPAAAPARAPAAPISEADTAPFSASVPTAGVPTAPSMQAVGTPSASRTGGTSASAPATGSRRASRPITVAPTGAQCPHCKGELPAGRPINFCPHCGQDLTVRHCPACGSELEHGWKFCVTCGRAAAAV
jgi:hypothetical protein